MRKTVILIALAALLVAMTACQTGGATTTTTTTTAATPAPTVAPTPAPTPAPAAGKTLTMSKTWTFENTTTWPANIVDGTKYDGITALGLGIMTGKLNQPKTGAVNGVNMTFTYRLQLPKNGNAANGALKVPVAGPCTIVIAGLSSGSSATRDIVISNGKKDLFSKTLNLVSTPDGDIITYNITAADLVDGNVYLYTNDPGGAISLYYIGLGK